MFLLQCKTSVVLTILLGIQEIPKKEEPFIKSCHYFCHNIQNSCLYHICQCSVCMLLNLNFAFKQLTAIAIKQKKERICKKYQHTGRCLLPDFDLCIYLFTTLDPAFLILFRILKQKTAKDCFSQFLGFDVLNNSFVFSSKTCFSVCLLFS